MNPSKLIRLLRPYAKAVAPAALAVLAVLARWLVTGDWDAHQWDIALTGLLAATVSYFVPNAKIDELLVHPSARALDWLGQRPIPDHAPVLPDEDEGTLTANLEDTNALAENEGVLKPAPPDTTHPTEAALTTSRATAAGRAVMRAARAVSHTQHYVNVASQHGCRKGLAVVIITCARLRGVPISLGFALIHHESGFRKVFGHDPTIFVGAGLVTRAKFLAYRAKRIASGNRLMQGVGEGQLTWWATQDAADRRGGCWRAKANVDTSFITLGANIHRYGYALGVERYNGYGAAAVSYSRAVRAEAAWWHHELTKGLP